MRDRPRSQSKSTNPKRAAQTTSVDAETKPRRVDGYDPDFAIFTRLDRRLRKNRRAAKELERTPWGRAVLPMARGMLRVFWDEQCDAAIYGEHANCARWLLKRRGTWTAWFREHGGVPADIDRGFTEIKGILAEDRRAGRPSKARFHDLVAACALLYRAMHGQTRVPDYGPLARFLELPEFGYPLTARRVSEIANEVVRSFASGDGAARYPASFAVCGILGGYLLKQHNERGGRQIERAEKPRLEV